jgi:hypothetical protein
MTIVETSDNRFYRVTETGHPNLTHVWFGVQVKRSKGEWVMVPASLKRYSNGRPEMVRKAATRIVVGG